ncbi:hypothetical protein PQX77_019335 [Marasmius sp. AFHP31]|nr:hypothetical protein PQX77_019335 [Marasmius sp. AFHP31]
MDHIQVYRADCVTLSANRESHIPLSIESVDLPSADTSSTGRSYEDASSDPNSTLADSSVCSGGFGIHLTAIQQSDVEWSGTRNCTNTSVSTSFTDADTMLPPSTVTLTRIRLSATLPIRPFALRITPQIRSSLPTSMCRSGLRSKEDLLLELINDAGYHLPFVPNVRSIFHRLSGPVHAITSSDEQSMSPYGSGRDWGNADGNNDLD